jgi:Flp pilus assembly protein TadG
MRTMSRDKKSTARFQGDRGSVLVEAAFIFPVVFFICLAIFEYGMLFAAQSTTESSTRDGARYASANFAVSGGNQAAADQVATAVDQDLSARTGFDTPIQMVVYKADANGNPTGGFGTCSADCYVYSWNGSSFVYNPAASFPWTNPQACVSTGNTIDTIGVYVQLRHNYITNAFGSSQTIKEHTVSRLEPLPANQCS